MKLSRRLDSIAQKYDPSSPKRDFDYWLIRFDFETLENFLIGENVIELGCGRGVLTEKLAGSTQKLTVVEGSRNNIRHVKGILGKGSSVRFVHSLWEKFSYRAKDISDVVFFMGLEHLERKTARKVLRTISTWLRPGGRLHVVVPNASSLHRKVAYWAGMIKDVHELSERDRWGGHKLVYDKEMLFRELEAAGYRITHWEGIFIKPLTNAQMMGLSEGVLRGFARLGKELPDWCAHTYALCEKGK